METDKVKQAKDQQQQEKEQEALNQQKLQLQQALGEVIEPIQTALVDLQGKYQVLQEQQAKSVEPPIKTAEQEMSEMLGDLDDDSRYDKLSNKQMLDVISTSLDSALKSNAHNVRESITDDIQPMVEKLGTLEKTTLQIIAGMGVKDARSKHSDFDEHVAEIKVVLNRYPGMDYNDAYLLAKSQKAGAVPPVDQIASEKPQSAGVIPPQGPSPTALTTDNMDTMAQRGKDSRSGRQMHGRAGFMTIVKAAADKVLSARD